MKENNTPNDNNNTNNKTEPNYTLRIIIGSALFYLVSKLYLSFGELKGVERTVGLIFMIFFSVVSVVILVTSIYGWYKASKKRKNESLENDSLNNNSLNNEDKSQED